MLSIAHIATITPPLQLLLGGVGGGAAGAAYFGALRLNVRCYARRAIGTGLAMQAVRFAILSCVLYGLAKIGAIALLSGLAALLVARHVVLRMPGAPT